MLGNHKLVFNFFNRDDTLKALSEHFNLSKGDVKQFVVLNAENDNSALDFINQFNINLIDTYVSNVYLTCKHVTTAHDNLESIKKYGLLSLKDALTVDSLLRQFLTDNQIVIDVENKFLKYKDNHVYLFEYNEDCNNCFLGKCRHERLTWDGKIDISHKNLWCAHRKKLMLLCVKLYSHKAELEVHLAGDDEVIFDYSYVKEFPEILSTIEDTIHKIFSEYTYLGYKWAKLQNEQFYVMEFDVGINSFEYINTKDLLDNTYYYSHYLETCGIDPDAIDDWDNLNEELIPSQFFSNIFLIQNSLSVVTGHYGKQYGQLFPETIVNFEDLRIVKLHI